MKTEVIMKRPFMGSEIRQKSKTGMMSATDLVRVGNIKRRELGMRDFSLTAFLKTKQTKEFIEELQKSNERVIVKSKQKGSHQTTWVHPLLFMDIALAMNAKFKVQVYEWIHDELLKNRNESGESYRKMTGALYERVSDKQRFHKYITKVAGHIKKKCDVEDWNTASPEQLKLRDTMHDKIATLSTVLKNPDDAVRLGTHQALEDQKKKLSAA